MIKVSSANGDGKVRAYLQAPTPADVYESPFTTAEATAHAPPGCKVIKDEAQGCFLACNAQCPAMNASKAWTALGSKVDAVAVLLGGCRVIDVDSTRMDLEVED